MAETFYIEGLFEFLKKEISECKEKGNSELECLNFNNIMLEQNPYILKSKSYLLSVPEIVKNLFDNRIFETQQVNFDEFSKKIAIFVAHKVYGGTKSSAEGIDLEFEKDAVRFIVSIKSGPNWGNSGQIQKMKDNFKKTKKIIGTNASKINVIAVNGCCYGRDNKPDKGDYLKLCGQSFWEFISGNSNFFIEIIEPLSFQSKEKNDLYLQSYAQMLNKFILKFTTEFCDDGIINWERIVKFNSAIEKPN